VNRSDLIARMTERLGGDRASAVAAVSGVLEEIEAGVARGERVTLSGFGTFEGRARAARTARNPRTGEAVRVDASVVPVFRAAAGFKSLVHLPDGASEPGPVTGDARRITATKLEVLASPSADTSAPAVGAKPAGSRKKVRKAEQAAEKDGKVAKAAEKASKKARKAAKSKAGKKSA
jgi:DNA-binding protein HU-beta